MRFIFARRLFAVCPFAVFVLLAGFVLLSMPVASAPGASAFAGQIPAANGIESLGDRVKAHVLPNGMRFLLLERHNSPTVSFHVYFDVGSVDEPIGQTGIAHLYEHMAFKGTKQIGTTNYEEESKHFPVIDNLEAELSAEKDKGPAADQNKIQELTTSLKKETDEAEKYVIPNQLGEIYQENGASGLNAQTERDQTHYLVSLPSNKIELWMAIESDRIQNGVLRELYKERDVVMEEVRRTIDTNPITRLILEDVITTAFRAHPYGLHSGIGWTSDVSHLTRPEVQAFFDKYYGAANCTVAIVGDFDTARVIPMLDRYFGAIRSGTKNPGVITVEPVQQGERRVQLEASVQPILALAYHRPNALSDDDVVYDVISRLLTDGRTSILYKNLVEGKQIAVGVQSLSQPPLITGKYPSLFEIFAAPAMPGHTIADLETAIYDQMDKLETQPVDKHDLQKLINQVDVAFLRGMADNETLAQLLVFTQGVEGDWRRILTYRKRLAAVTPEDVMRVAKATFGKWNRTVAYIVPKETAPVPPPPPPQPEPGPSPEQQARGKAILEQARQAIGAKAAAAIKDFSIKMAANLSFQGQEIQAAGTSQALLPDKFMTEISLPAMGQTVDQFMNGGSAWMVRGGASSDMPAAAAAEAKADFERTVLVYFLQSPNGSIPTAVAEPDQLVDGKPADTVSVSGAGVATITLLFDKSTHQLLQARFERPHPITQQPSKGRESFYDFHAEGGIVVPHHTVMTLDGDKFSDVTITEFKVNAGLDPNTFDKK